MSNTGKKDPYRWVVLAFVFAFYFVVLGFTNQAFNVLLRPIAVDMKWTSVQTTAIATAMYGGMIWFVFVAGALLDRFSAKKIMVATAILVAVVFFLRGYAQDFTFFFTLMFIYGIASAFYMPSVIKLISLWFDTDEIALANGVLTSGSPFGQLFANLFGYNIAMAVGGWRSLFMITGVAALVLAAFYFFILKERKSSEAALKSDVIKKEDLTFWRNIGGIAKTPMVWVYAIANACFLGTIYAMMTYQNFVFQADPRWALPASLSGTIPAFSNMVSMFAYSVVPLIIMKLKLQKYYPVVAAICGVIAVTAPITGYYAYNFTWMCAAMAISGLTYGAALPAPRVFMLQLPEVSGPRAGTAMGLYVTIERVGVTVLVGLIGGFVTKSPVGASMVLANFNFIMYISPILIIVGWLITKNKLKKQAIADASVKKEPTAE